MLQRVGCQHAAVQFRLGSGGKSHASRDPNCEWIRTRGRVKLQRAERARGVPAFVEHVIPPRVISIGPGLRLLLLLLLLLCHIVCHERHLHLLLLPATELGAQIPAHPHAGLLLHNPKPAPHGALGASSLGNPHRFFSWSRSSILHSARSAALLSKEDSSSQRDNRGAGESGVDLTGTFWPPPRDLAPFSVTWKVVDPPIEMRTPPPFPVPITGMIFGPQNLGLSLDHASQLHVTSFRIHAALPLRKWPLVPAPPAFPPLIPRNRVSVSSRRNPAAPPPWWCRGGSLPSGILLAMRKHEGTSVASSGAEPGRSVVFASNTN